MHRLKSHLLTKENNTWYYQNNLYTGVIFFDKEDCIVEPFYVEEGVITRLYISPCQQGLPSPIQIDCTGFWNQDEDIYDVGGVPQLYKGNLYHGMCYAFEEGICVGENYTLENGVTKNRLLWNKKDHELWKLEMTTLENEWFYYDDLEENSFIYSNLQPNDKIQAVLLGFYTSNKRVSSFNVSGNILNSKNYMNIPVPLPKIYSMLENYESFIFTDFFVLELNEYINENLLKIWINNNSFRFTEKLLVEGVEMLKDLMLFNNKKAFPNLKKIIFSKNKINRNVPFSSKELNAINKLRNKKPHFKVEIE